MRRAARIDSNQAEIVSALEAMGCSVQSLAQVGNGCPDLLVAMGPHHVLLEVKVPGEQLNPQQKRWHASWRGRAHVVYGVADAIAVMGHYGRRAA